MNLSEILNQLPPNDLNALGRIAKFQVSLEQLEHWGALCFFTLLQDNMNFNANKVFSIIDIYSSLRVLEKYRRLVLSLLGVLEKYELVRKIDNGYYQLIKSDRRTIQKLDAELLFLIKKHPVIKVNALFLQRVMKAYLSILSGQEDFLPIMFPNGSFEFIEHTYRHTPMAEYYNQRLSQIVIRVSEYFLKLQLKEVSIIEVGAGIGATSEKVLPELNNLNLCQEYCYTDISKAFLRHAEALFKQYSFLDYCTLNLEQAPKAQGFVLRRYNIVLATNVIHATRNLVETLAHLHSLLVPGGVLIINEGVNKRTFSTLAYGLMDGWWRFEDSQWRIADSPLVSLSNWKFLLSQQQFFDIVSLNEIAGFEEKIFQDVIIATR